MGVTDDLVALWVDGAFNVAGLDAGLQVGSIDLGDNTLALGAKVGGKADIISYGLAVTDVDDGGPLGVVNNGGGTDNSLYTTLENNVGLERKSVG